MQSPPSLSIPSFNVCLFWLPEPDFGRNWSWWFQCTNRFWPNPQYLLLTLSSFSLYLCICLPISTWSSHLILFSPPAIKISFGARAKTSNNNNRCSVALSLLYLFFFLVSLPFSSEEKMVKGIELSCQNAPLFIVYKDSKSCFEYDLHNREYD